MFTVSENETVGSRQYEGFCLLLAPEEGVGSGLAVQAWWGMMHGCQPERSQIMK